MVVSATAQTTNSWISVDADVHGFGGFWDDAFRWDNGTPSITQAVVMVTNAVTKFVRIDEFSPAASLNISNLLISAPSGSTNAVVLTNFDGSAELQVVNAITINAGGRLSINTNSTVRVEGVSGGALRVDGELEARENGLLVASNLVVASSLSSTGSVHVSDSAQLVLTNSSTSIGSAGVGQLTVSSGGLDARDIIVGHLAGARGTINFAGGTSRIAGATSIGLGAGSSGTVWITGGVVDATNGFGFVVGTVGSGQLILSNGVLRRGLIQVGFNNGSAGTLTVAGGAWEGPAALQAGNNFGATGTVWVTGGSLALTNNSLLNTIGNGGIGRMSVSNGLVTANILNLGSGAGAGSFNVAGGTNTVYSTLTLGNFTCTATGNVTIVAGRLDVTNSTGTAVLNVLSGTLTLSGGLLNVDRLVITNACGHFLRTAGSLNVALRVLGAGLDADGDGLPNDWEELFGFDPLSASGNDGADADPDGDGLSNAQEFAIGTDPTDATDPLRITAIEREGNDIRVTWRSAAGTTNLVQVSAGNEDGSYTNDFTDLPPAIVVTGAGVVTTNRVDEGGATNTPARYYRIKLVP